MKLLSLQLDNKVFCPRIEIVFTDDSCSLRCFGISLNVKEKSRRTRMPLLMDKTKFHLQNLLMMKPHCLAVVLMDTAGKITSVAYYC